ncbi:MAG: hypothetical protein ACI8RP_000879 [Urechidicola sp.]|jgi:hypothetical protein
MKNIVYLFIISIFLSSIKGGLGGYRKANPVNIHVIAIGIDNVPVFDGQPSNFKNCVNDAKAITAKILKDKIPRVLVKTTTTGTRGFNTNKEAKDLLKTKDTTKIVTHLLLNENATLQNIKNAFKEVIKNSTTNDYFVFYFAGMSLPVKNGETILIPHIANSDKKIKINDYKTYDHLSLVELANYMNQIAAAKQFIISEAGPGKEFANNLQSALFESDIELAENSERNRVILTTISYGYDSSDCNPSHGPLTNYILESGNMLDVFENYYNYEYKLNKTEIKCSPRGTRYYYLTQEKDYTDILKRHQAKISGTRGAIAKKLKNDKKTELGDTETYALIIATNVYNENQHSWGDLKNPLNDANSISEILENKYNVKVSKLYNEPKKEIQKGIIALKQQIDANDKLLIFIAGHGYFSEDFAQGYIVTTDTKSLEDDTTLDSYFSMSSLNSLLDGFPSKQIFTVLDICYGASFEINNADLPIENYSNTKIDNGIENFIKEVDKSYSRIMLASGEQEVLDYWKPNEKHSPFADKLIKAFEQEKEFISPGKIYSYVKGSATMPILKKFGKHEVTGDFLLKVATID